jgi:TolB protein
MKKFVWILAAYAAAQQPNISVILTGGERPTIAVPDFRGAGDAQRFMPAFNQTLWSDLEGSGFLKLVSKSMYPPAVPQQPSDFTQPTAPAAAPPRGKNQPAPPQTGGGRWLSDWSGPPVNTKYLAFGYTAAANGVLVLRGFLYDVTNPSGPQVLAQNYNASLDEGGARKVAHEFAADILKALGGQSIYGSHIYFTSDRSGSQEIWMMDPDGKNQRQITSFKFLSMGPSASPDGQKVAFTSYRNTNPGIFVFSVDPVRDLRFYNQRASVNTTPSFTPDGKQIVYASSAPNDKCCRIFIANVDGTGFRPLTSANKIEVEPKVNPKGGDILFVSGRSGPQQIYKMNMDGADVERITDGTGEASNPSWHPNGKAMAFAWTRGYAAGAWNVFVMDIASRSYIQLTHGEGKNENPSWSPSGTHLAFASTRTGKSQIYVMTADRSSIQPLTSQGSNTKPFWGK